MDAAVINFKLEGPIFNTGIPLLETITALQEFHSIVDRAYSARLNIPKLSKTERAHYRIVAETFRRGSFETDLLFTVASSAQLLFPDLREFGAKELWETVKAAYTYLKAVVTARNEGKEPIINIGGHHNTLVIVKDNSIEVGKVVYNAADKSEQHYKKLTSIIEEGKINSIATLDRQGEGPVLTSRERTLFNPKTNLEKDVIPIQCNIYRFDKDANTGKLRVSDGQPIPPGEYNFKPVTKQDNRRFIISMMNPSVTLYVLKEVETHTSGLKRISYLHVVEFEDQQQDSLFVV